MQIKAQPFSDAIAVEVSILSSCAVLFLGTLKDSCLCCKAQH